MAEPPVTRFPSRPHNFNFGYNTPDEHSVSYVSRQGSKL